MNMAFVPDQTRLQILALSFLGKQQNRNHDTSSFGFGREKAKHCGVKKKEIPAIKTSV
jgi:hypothetical protein